MPAKAPKPIAPSTPQPPTIAPATIQPRHRALLATFALVVLLPILVAAFYLGTRAVDQYASTVGFSVRRENSATAGDLLGSIGLGSGSSSSDIEVLYQFIQSQDLVARIDARLDLREAFSRHHGRDPFFSLSPNATIEDIVAFWRRQVSIFYDNQSGLIELRVLAFTPEEAQAIAMEIIDESTVLVNQLSAIARDDALSYARAELEAAQDRLRTAREELTAFRSLQQIVDPEADVQGQMGLLNQLHAQLAATMVDLDLLRVSTQESDPRIGQALRRIEVIERRIAGERAKFGLGLAPGILDDARAGVPAAESYADVMAGFERLAVEREFAEQTYMAALANYDSVLAEAQRKSRYLATHIAPTLAERSGYPERLTMLGIGSLFLVLAWSIGALMYYSVRDRR